MDEGSMLPPARKTPLSTNEDFRKLLETPRVNRGDDETPSRRPKKTTDSKPKKRPPRPKPEAEKPEQDGDGYRDRAQERRKGFNPDYERVAADLAGLVGGNAAGDLNTLSVEDSKYLGGDVDHTHLVKGLDFALLQKTRGEMTKEEESAKTDPKSKLKARQEAEVVKFKGVAGRAVFNTVFKRSKLKANDLFLPGRTAFVFDLETAFSPDIPTTLRRSKADCPEVEEAIRGGMDTTVLERMVKIMSYMRGTGSKPGKLRKKDKLRMLQMMDGVAATNNVRESDQDGATPAGPVDADEDIFGDAGRDYIPEMPSTTNGTANGGQHDASDDMIPPPPPLPPQGPVGPARPSGGYDAAAAAYAAYGDAPAEAPPPPPPVPQQQYDAEDMELDQLAGLAPPPPPTLEADVAAQPKREKKETAEVIPRDTEDAYEECYPDYGGFTGAVVDSDDEDLTHMDSKEGKSRYDFETEEQWEKYKSNKEMMPKAAFQFGVKMTDGRKGHKQLGKGVEQKEQKQLKKIQGIINKDHGGKYSKAFADDSEAGGGQSFSKRRRI